MLRRSLRQPAVVILAGAVSAALMTLDQTPAEVQAAASALLVFVLLGTALSIALLPSRRLDFAERVAFVLGLGLSTVIIDGFILNASAAGLTRANWALSLGVITVVAGAVGWYRDRIADTTLADTTLNADDPELVEPWSGVRRIRISASATVVIASTALVAAAFAIAAIGLDRQPQPGFTELWLLPSGSSAGLTVGVSNHEAGNEMYDLEVTADGVPLARWNALSLANGETWTAPLVLQPRGQVGASVRATLVRVGDPTTIYREASIRLDPTPPTASTLTN